MVQGMCVTYRPILLSWTDLVLGVRNRLPEVFVTDAIKRPALYRFE